MLLPHDVFPHLYLNDEVNDEATPPELSPKGCVPSGVTVRRLPGGCLLYTLPATVRTRKRST